MRITLEIHPAEGPCFPVLVHHFPFTIGRQPDCDLALDDDKVSRRHLAIELEDDRPRWQDLGSANGFRLHDRKERQARLRSTDRIKIGNTIIRVTAIEREASSAPTEARVLEGSTQRRRVNLLMPIFVVVAFLAYGGYLIVRSEANAARDPRDLEALAEAREQIMNFDAELARAPAVTEALWQRAREIIDEYSHLDFGPGERPLDRLHSMVTRRRSQEFQALTETLRERTADAWLSGELGIVYDAIREFEAANELVGRTEQRWLEDFHLSVDERLEQGFVALRRRTAFLLDDGYPREMRELDALARREFARTPREADAIALGEKLRAAAESLADLESDAEAATARRIEATPELEGAMPENLIAWIDAGLRQAGSVDVPIAFGHFQGTIAGYADATTLAVDAADGRRALPLAELTPRIQLALAEHLLTGERLLIAARLGHRWGFPREADRLFHRYALEDPAAHPPVVDTVLAELREVPRSDDYVPFVYSEEYGYESRVDVARRTVLATLETIDLRPRRSLEELRASLAAALPPLESDDMPRPVRVEYRNRLVERVTELQASLLEEVDKPLGRPLEKLAELRIDLDRRRAEALAVIMDPKIYLPEDHPDWRKGDVVNGQKRVDEEVAKVRELWNDASLSFSLGDRVRTKMATIVALETEFLARLDPERQDVPRLIALIALNPGPVLSLKTFAADARQRELQRFNARVKTYHATFSHPELPVKDLEHIQFVNDYREMMGVRRCFVDVRLCIATRKHSEVCNAAGAIWHVGKDGSPGSRARAESFEDPVGENVALGYGNPQDIWTRGWYRASDHHRNGVAAGWNCMGYGYYGQVGTQNFATIAPPWQGEGVERGEVIGDF